MCGIMIKDFYETLCLKRNMLDFIINLFLLAGAVFAARNFLAFILIIVVVLPLTAVSPLQYSMKQDETSGYEKILATFPVTRKEIVRTKIIETYLFGLLSNVLLALPVTLLYAGYYKVSTIQEGMHIFILGIIVFLIMNPIYNVGFFQLGSRRGTIIYLLLAFLTAMFYVFIENRYTFSAMLSISPWQWMPAGFVLAFIFSAAGYFLCIKIYEKKHS